MPWGQLYMNFFNKTLNIFEPHLSQLYMRKEEELTPRHVWITQGNVNELLVEGLLAPDRL